MVFSDSGNVTQNDRRGGVSPPEPPVNNENVTYNNRRERSHLPVRSVLLPEAEVSTGHPHRPRRPAPPSAFRIAIHVPRYNSKRRGRQRAPLQLVKPKFPGNKERGQTQRSAPEDICITS